MEKEKELPNVPVRCQGLTKSIKSDGGPITKEIAGRYLANYFSGIGDPQGQNHNYGYVFGLDKLNDFVDAINNYNDNGDLPDEQTIVGVRVYLARTEKVSASLPVPPDKVVDSLFIMPVLATGFDMYKMPTLQDGAEIILGNPRPCPNECLILSFADL